MLFRCILISHRFVSEHRKVRPPGSSCLQLDRCHTAEGIDNWRGVAWHLTELTAPLAPGKRITAEVRTRRYFSDLKSQSCAVIV